MIVIFVIGAALLLSAWVIVDFQNGRLYQRYVPVLLLIGLGLHVWATYLSIIRVAEGLYNLSYLVLLPPLFAFSDMIRQIRLSAYPGELPHGAYEAGAGRLLLWVNVSMFAWGVLTTAQVSWFLVLADRLKG